MPDLYPFQHEGADFLAGRSTAMLCDDPGLGKSAQVVTAADRAGAQRVLIVPPASLKVNWAREFAKFSAHDWPVVYPNGKGEVRIPPTGRLLVIANYDIVTRKTLHRQLAGLHWDVMACDEAHALKNPASLRTRAVLGQVGLHHAADRTWLVSGTPVPNHPGELYPALSALYPQATGGMDYETWLHHYCYVIAGTHGPKVTGIRPQRLAELRAIRQGFLLRRKREEVLPDMPALRTGTLVVENSKALAALPADVAPEIAALVGDPDAAEETLEELDETELSTLRRLCGEAKAHALVDEVAGELDGGTDKIVLMCWHRATMDILQAGLARFGVARIDGSTTNRQEQVDRFQNDHYHTDCRVFVGQLQAAGAGHTLTAASDMIIVEPSWTPGENTQAMLRIHRIGQTRSCLVRFAALAGSIDEAIMAVAARKAGMIADLLL